MIVVEWKLTIVWHQEPCMVGRAIKPEWGLWVEPQAKLVRGGMVKHGSCDPFY